MADRSESMVVESRLLELKREVAALNQVKEALQESERKLSILMNNLPGMVYRCANDEHWTIEFASKGTYELLGYDPAKLIGSPIYTFRELVHLEDRPNNLVSIDNALKERRPYQLVYRIRTCSGQDKWVWDQGEGIFSQDGQLLALEGFITDISVHKLAAIRLQEENQMLRSSISERYKFRDIIGKSPAMQRVYDLILKAAAGRSNVMVYGESGTGKELVARAIHDLSECRNRAFVPVNCGAIPENLMESEFFGYKKGAFSGAGADKSGYLDMADKGTLFLDELGEISLGVQVKLLRVLDGMGYMPVGGNSVKKSDTRIITATNRDIKAMIAQGKMREDFYYRIHIIPIFLPPLRERKEDIPLLVEHFMKQHGVDADLDYIPLNLRMAFENYDWPGNIRELRNVVERFLTLGETDFLKKIDSFSPVASADTPKTLYGSLSSEDNSDFRSAVENFEKEFILKILDRCRWHKGNAATVMGMTARTLQRKLSRYRIK